MRPLDEIFFSLRFFAKLEPLLLLFARASRWGSEVELACQWALLLIRPRLAARPKKNAARSPARSSLPLSRCCPSLPLLARSTKKERERPVCCLALDSLAPSLLESLTITWGLRDRRTRSSVCSRERKRRNQRTRERRPPLPPPFLVSLVHPKKRSRFSFSLS